MSNGVSFVPTNTTSYTVTGTGANGCTNTAQTTVTVNALPTVSGGSNQTICSGQSVTLTGIGTATSYSWNNGVSNGVSFVPTNTTTYTVTGTDNNGCTNSANITVSVGNALTVNAGFDVNVCIGNTVALNAIANGTITWSGGITNNQPFAPVVSGMYIASAINSIGCYGTDTVYVTVNSLPLVNAGPDQSICPGMSITLNGSGATSYFWNNGITNGVSFTPTQTSTYTVTGTDNNGCSNTDEVTVSINGSPSVNAGADVTMCEGGSVTLNATSNAPISWSGGVVNNQSFIPSTTTTYVVTASSGAGCSNTDTVLVTVLSLPIVNAGADQIVCVGNQVTLNASGAINYTWNNSASNGVAFIPSQTTTYIVTGTDVNGCSNTDDVLVTVLSLPIVTAGSDATICDGSNITLTANGSATSYTWNNGVVDGVAFMPIQTATYTVTGTSANGCTATDDITITVNPLPTINAGNDVSVCNGNAVTLNAISSAAIYWNNGVVNNQAFTPTSTSTYTATATDNFGCTQNDDVIVTVHALPTVNAGSDVSVCVGNTVTLVGTGALNYTWTGGVINATSFIPNTTASYTVTGTDANGCSNSDDLVITVNALPTASAGNDKVICLNGNTTLTASTGASYLWSNGATTQAVNVGVGNYSVTITNNSGCSATSPTVTITSKALPGTIKIKTVGLASVCEPFTIPLVIDLAPGVTAGFAYQWNMNGNAIVGATDSTYTALTTGSYSLSVSGGNTCNKTSAAKTATIKPLPVANFSAGGVTTFCTGGSVVLSAPAITGYTYNWLKDGANAGAGVTKTFKLSGVYTVIATLAGCKDTADNPITILVNPLPIAAISTNDTTTFCTGSSALLNASPSSTGFNFKWYSGTTMIDSSANDTYAAMLTGTYKVVVIDANNCVSKMSLTNVKIKVNPILVPTIAAVGSTTISVSGSVKLNANPSTGVTWQWYKDGNAILGATTKQYIATTGGDYTVAVTKSGCIGTSTATTVTQSGIREVNGNMSDASFELTAFPNPVTEKLIVSIKGIEGVDAEIQVIDYAGNLVSTQSMKEIQATIDFNHMASGAYLIRYKDKEGRTGTLKVTKD